MGLQSVLSTSSPLILHSHFPAPLWDPWAGGTAWNRGTACSPFSLPLPLPFIFSFPPFFFAFFLLFIFLSPFLFPFFPFFPLFLSFSLLFFLFFPFLSFEGQKKKSTRLFCLFCARKRDANSLLYERFLQLMHSQCSRSCQFVAEITIR